MLRLVFTLGSRVKVGPKKPNGEAHPHAGKIGRITRFLDLDKVMVRLDTESPTVIFVSAACLESPDQMKVPTKHSPPPAVKAMTAEEIQAMAAKKIQAMTAEEINAMSSEEKLRFAIAYIMQGLSCRDQPSSSERFLVTLLRKVFAP